MRPATARMLTRLYPRAWRRRYGAEFEALLEDEPRALLTAFNVMRAAIRERIVPTVGACMTEPVYSFGDVSKKPSALIPLAMSGAALLLLAYALLPTVLHHQPIVRHRDEGTFARLWQLLMTVQMPVVLFFAVKWLGRAPRQTLGVLAMQATAWLAALAPVYLLHL